MIQSGQRNPVEDERLEVVSVRTRPDLLPVIAKWLWHQWWKEEGRSLEETEAIYAECCNEVGAPQTLILLADGIPIATVTLARNDLDERPTLTPWLAGVCVIPARRGKGYIYHLLEAFDAACRQASVKTAWLFTNTAERVYLRAGWRAVEIVERPGKLPVTLMSRDYV